MPSVMNGLLGCWQGDGSVMGKPVSITLEGKFILRYAMFSVDIQSQAKANPQDDYAAHLVFGSAPSEALIGIWTDSFGGAYIATGHGATRRDGFDMAYRYPDSTFVNRWNVTKARIAWDIVMSGKDGKTKPFAAYIFHRHSCDHARELLKT
ncbi:hypothetical protein [Kozakia baliensis]|uniref:hypothetical protein n=1 Tax=Kozakia baliensis TaxID=153496 RepID=UPI0012479640|nr:hypothetical protein [Kozakia baliensis]